MPFSELARRILQNGGVDRLNSRPLFFICGCFAFFLKKKTKKNKKKYVVCWLTDIAMKEGYCFPCETRDFHEKLEIGVSVCSHCHFRIDSIVRLGKLLFVDDGGPFDHLSPHMRPTFSFEERGGAELSCGSAKNRNTANTAKASEQ